MVGAWARGVQLAAAIRRSGRFVTLSAGAIRGCLAATGGRTLYIYPEPYEGQECTKYVFCTGPTPAQKCWWIHPGSRRARSGILGTSHCPVATTPGACVLVSDAVALWGQMA